MGRKLLLLHVSVAAIAWAGSAVSAAAAIVQDGQAQAAGNGKADAAKAGKKTKKPKARADTSAAARPKAADGATPQGSTADDDTSSTAGSAEIIVTGVRQSIAAARNEKRKAKQIVDVVKAEDIGKLPNNNLGDVVSLVPGIQVGRSVGEVGDDLRLRGLSGVQTTLNGNSLFSGIERSAYLNGVPADIISSVEVYKTRTPDQVEGSYGGTINVTLRKPTEFKLGATYAINARGTYNNQSRKVSDNYTGIVNYRAETPIGELGFTVTGTYNTNRYLESLAFNDALVAINPQQVISGPLPPVPAYGPWQTAFNYYSGTIERPSATVTTQWKPNDKLSILLEGSYFKHLRDERTDQFYVRILSGTGSSLPALSNVKLVPGTNRLSSVTVAPVDTFGPIHYSRQYNGDTYIGRYAAEYKDEQFDWSGEFTYSSSVGYDDRQEFWSAFALRPIFNVEFASDQFAYPMMNMNVSNFDLMDPTQYRFRSFFEQRWVEKGVELQARSDLTLRTGTKILPSLKFGFRNTTRKWNRDYGQRTTESNLLLPLSALPAPFQTLVPAAKGFGSTGVKNNAEWLTVSPDYIKNLPELRQLFAKTLPDFATPRPAVDPLAFFRGLEKTYAMYGQADYSVKLLFPIDGVFGARIVNTIVDIRSNSVTQGWQYINNAWAYVREATPNGGSANYLDIMPSFNAVIHFAEGLQLRAAYTRDVIRPDVRLLNPQIAIEPQNGVARGGNSKLKPETNQKYDLSLEYYFGSTGSIAIAPFYWKQQGAVQYYWLPNQTVPGAEGTFWVQRPYNVGRGYRRGVEVQGTGFFKFLPGALKGLGVSANYTYVDAKAKQPSSINPTDTIVENDVLPVFVAPHSFNVIGLYEWGGLNGRVSYNWRGKILTNSSINPVRNSEYQLPVAWLDAAVNYTIPSGFLKDVTFSIQGQNLLASPRRTFYGYPDLPRDTVYQAKMFLFGVRAKF